MNSNKSSRIVTPVAEAILAARWFILASFLVALFGFGIFASQFKIDASADTLLTQNNELFIKTQLANKKFSPAEFILVAYQPNSKKVFSQSAINDIELLSNKFSQLERVKTVNSMLSVPLIESRNQLMGNVAVDELNYYEQNYSPSEMERLLSDHPIYTDLLVNKEKTATAIQLVFKENPELNTLNNEIVALQAKLLDGELNQAQQTKLEGLKLKAKTIQEKIGKVRQQEVQSIERIIQEANLDANLYIGGSYVVGIRLIEIVTQDLLYFGAGISLLISALLLLLFRSAKWLLFPLFACVSSVVITLGLLALLNIPATVISANFVALQLILTLAIMLHLITCYREVSRDNPSMKQRERVLETLQLKIAPCFFAAITTSIGFASLMASGIQPVMDFGLMMLIANGVTLIIALLVFPSLLSFFKEKNESSELNFVSRFLLGLKASVIKRTKTYIIVPLVAMLLVSIGITKLNVENSFIDYFHQDTTIYKELSFIDQEFGGSTPLDIIIDMSPNAGQGDLFMRAEDVNTLHLGHAVVDAFEATGNVTSLINFTSLAQQLNDNKPLTEYELDVIYSLLDKAIVNQLIGAYIDTDTNTMRISTRIQDTLPDLNRAELLDNVRADLAATGLDKDSYQLTNLFVLYQDILSKLFDSQIATLGIVYGALAIVLLVIFRSIKLALIALVPNVLTTTTILGLIGLLGIPLDLMTITIAAIAMGIAIDDTIHFIDAYRTSESKQQLDGAFAHTGLAITYTSILIAVGFGMFVFSDFMPSVYFGILTACAMLFAFITDLTILPALLKSFVGNKQKA